MSTKSSTDKVQNDPWLPMIVIAMAQMLVADFHGGKSINISQ
jgi:hypothetical protein